MSQTGRIVAKLAELGIVVGEAAVPVANYLPYSVSNNQVHLCGHLPKRDGKMLHTGKVGQEVSVEQAQECARECIINMLATLKVALPKGDLDRIVKIVKLNVFVNSTQDFTQHPAVANGASDFVGQVFGEQGRHARSAVGCSSLPLGVPVEIDGIVEFKLD